MQGIIGSHDWPPTAVRTDIGEIIGRAISSLKAEYPFTSVLRRCIMPDHVHFILNVKETTDIHLGTLIKHIKNKCYSEIISSGYGEGTQIFAENYHDTFLTAGGQLQRMLDYVSDNPRRHLLRKMYPSWFQRFVISNGKACYDAYGNWDLLAEPLIVQVKAGKEFLKRKDEFKKLWIRTVLNDGILVSPFINKTEKDVRDWAIGKGGALIYVTSDIFSAKFKPEGNMFDLCGEGRIIIVSAPPLPEYKNLPENIAMRQQCVRMNEISAEIASGQFRPIRIGPGRE